MCDCNVPNRGQEIAQAVRWIQRARSVEDAKRIYDELPEIIKPNVRGLVHAAIGLTGGDNGGR